MLKISKTIMVLYFQNGRNNALPCIIFIDEIGLVGSKRVSNSIHPYANQTVNHVCFLAFSTGARPDFIFLSFFLGFFGFFIRSYVWYQHGAIIKVFIFSCWPK